VQCVNCQFENMPGSAACVRCGTSLRLATAAVAVHPPRATPLAKRLRSWFPLVFYYYRFREQLGRIDLRLPTWLTEALVTDRLRIGTWLRMIVPGWAHAHEGQWDRGRWYLLGWLAMAGLAVLTFGSALSALLAGLVLAVHAGSMIDLAWRSREFEDERTLFAVVVVWTAVACLVVVGLYVPLRQVVFSVIDARQWMDDEPPLAAGDVVLFRPLVNLSDLPQPGDVVVYSRGGYSLQQEYHRTLVRPPADAMDRIIAGPDTKVRWRQGKLTVNGQDSSVRPLAAERVPADFELEVPSGYVCIFPSTDSLLATSASLEQWTQLSLVPQHAILGRAVVRNYPFWRLWWIR